MSKKRNCFDIAMVAVLDHNCAFLKPGEAKGNYELAQNQFDEYTRGRVCVVGSHTAAKFDRVPEGELWIVVSHYAGEDEMFVDKGWIISRTFPQAMSMSNQLVKRHGSRPIKGATRPLVCVLGGVSVFRKTAPRAHYMYLQVLDFVKEENPRYLTLDVAGSSWKINKSVEHAPENANAWRTIELYRESLAANAA